MLENSLFRSSLRRFLQEELDVDRVWEDVTVAALGEAGRVPALAQLVARSPGIFCGVKVVEAFSDIFPGDLEVRALVADGARITDGTAVVSLVGPAGLCLSTERTLLNFLGHLSGIATLVRRYVDAVEGYPARILATRKTLPGLRDLQLYGVTAGGGLIHRRNLSDGIMFKENHQIFLDAKRAVAASRPRRSPLHRVEVEVQDLGMIRGLLADPPDVVMLDNMDIPTMEQACALLRGKSAIEVSGGVTLERAREIASLGVDYISVGQLTHSVPQLNISLDISPTVPRG